MNTQPHPVTKEFIERMDQVGIHQATIEVNPNYADVYRIRKLFSATGGGSVEYNPHELLKLVEELKGRQAWQIGLAFDAFSKATSIPGGPSLTMQRHRPTWEAFKNLCNTIARSKL